MSELLGVAAEGYALVGIILVGVAVGGKAIGIPTKPRGWFAGFGVIAIILAALAYVGVGALIGGPASIADSVQYDVSASESMSHVSFDKNKNMFTMACSFNDTNKEFNTQTQYFEATFNIEWAGGPVGEDSVAKCVLVDVDLVDVIGASDEYILDKNADDSYKALWTKTGGSAYENIGVLVSYGGESSVTINMTLNADAMAAMSENEMVNITFYVAGEMYTVQCMKDIVTI